MTSLPKGIYRAKGVRLDVATDDYGPSDRSPKLVAAEVGREPNPGLGGGRVLLIQPAAKVENLPPIQPV